MLAVNQPNKKSWKVPKSCRLTNRFIWKRKSEAPPPFENQRALSTRTRSFTKDVRACLQGTGKNFYQYKPVSRALALLPFQKILELVYRGHKFLLLNGVNKLSCLFTISQRFCSLTLFKRALERTRTIRECLQRTRINDRPLTLSNEVGSCLQRTRISAVRRGE